MITPIAITFVDWPNYLLKAKQSLGFSVSDSIDKYRLKQDLTSFFISLTEWYQENVDPSKTIREAGSLLRHGSASFLCLLSGSILFQFQQETDLAINATDIKNGLTLAIVSGTIKQWQEAIINCSSDRLSTETRQVANQFMVYFESIGLGGIWSNYKKTPMNDETLKLDFK